MKTFRNICVAAALGTALLLPSCKKDFLETNPTTSLSDAVVESTLPGVEVLINGLHNMMYMYSFGQVFGNGHMSLGTQLDMLSDDMINTQPAYHMGSSRYNDPRNPEGSLNLKAWDFYYTIIQHANKALMALDNIKPEVNAQTKRLWGTAHAFRAWAYHNLVQLFAKRYEPGQPNAQLGVILRLAPNIDKMPRATVAEVYAQIDQDLNKALTYLKDVPNSERKNDMRYATVCGIAARVALTKSDWTNAAKYAEEGMKNSGATLQAGNALLDGFNNMDATEWIWGYRQNPEQSLFFAGYGAQYASNFDGHQKALRFAVNRSLYDAMGAEDVRRKWWICLDLNHHIPANGLGLEYFLGGEDPARARWEVTGQHVKFQTQNGAKDSRMDNVAMRLGELYYIKAEAEANLGKEAQARESLNVVMRTRDPQYSTNATGKELVDEILRNKRLDLWFEGQAFFDMKRLKRVPNRLAAKNFEILESLQGKTARIKAEARHQGALARYIPVSVEDKNWEFAIPYDETKGNDLCKPNPL